MVGDLSMSTLGNSDILMSKPIEVSGTGIAMPPCGGKPGGCPDAGGAIIEESDISMLTSGAATSGGATTCGAGADGTNIVGGAGGAGG